MKLESIQDIEKLPSVLNVEETNRHLIELIAIIKKTHLGYVESAEAINYLISCQEYNETGLTVETSKLILDWIKEIYNPNNRDLIKWISGNLANLTCQAAKDFIGNRLNLTISEFERQELIEALTEIKVKT